MPNERLAQLKQIVEYFHDQTPTEQQIFDYCQEQKIDAIDAGTLEDWTFQYDVDKLRNESLSEVCDVISNWDAPSEFDPADKKQAAFKKLERDILALYEDRNTRFDVLMS